MKRPFLPQAIKLRGSLRPVSIFSVLELVEFHKYINELLSLIAAKDVPSESQPNPVQDLRRVKQNLTDSHNLIFKEKITMYTQA